MSYTHYLEGLQGGVPLINNKSYEKGREDKKSRRIPMDKVSFDLWKTLQRPKVTDKCSECGENVHPGMCKVPVAPQVQPLRSGDYITGIMHMEQPAAKSGAMREKLNTIPYDLIPFQEFTDAFVHVAEFGAIKYEAWNWSKGLSRVQLMGSLLRHTFAYLRGEDFDKETKLLHTDHIIWNACVLCHNVHHSLEDGRRPEPKRDYHK